MLNPIDYLELQAKAQPEKLSLCDAGNSNTYRQCFIFVKQLAKRLGTMGVQPGQVVLTCLPTQLDWVVTSALMHEACIPCSNTSYNVPSTVLTPDWVISNKKIENFPEEKVIVIDEAWIKETQKEMTLPAMKSYASEEAICRLMLTSGTTGEAKAVPFSLKTLNQRVHGLTSFWMGSGSSISMMAMSTVGGFFGAMHTAMCGETLYCPNSVSDAIDMIEKFQIKTLIASPIQLAFLLQDSKITKEKMISIKEIRCAGGMMTQKLVEGLRKIFDAQIFTIYGSTETGGICINMVKEQHHPLYAGFLIPGVTVEAVNEAHEPLPVGVEGLIRMKSSRMVQEYYNNPEETAVTFKDGWFYPGDRGCVVKGGFLILSGRHSELINRGGVKINPMMIDQFLLSYPGVKDAAAFGLENKTGVQDLAAAIVVPKSFDLKKLQVDLSSKFGQALAPSVYFNVKQIPRNAMGKVMRAEMSKQFAATMNKK